MMNTFKIDDDVVVCEDGKPGRRVNGIVTDVTTTQVKVKFKSWSTPNKAAGVNDVFEVWFASIPCVTDYACEVDLGFGDTDLYTLITAEASNEIDQLNFYNPVTVSDLRGTSDASS